MRANLDKIMEKITEIKHILGDRFDFLNEQVNDDEYIFFMNNCSMVHVNGLLGLSTKYLSNISDSHIRDFETKITIKL